MTCKNRLPYNLYCVGGDVKHCTIQSNPSSSTLCGQGSAPTDSSEDRAALFHHRSTTSSDYAATATAANVHGPGYAHEHGGALQHRCLHRHGPVNEDTRHEDSFCLICRAVPITIKAPLYLHSDLRCGQSTTSSFCQSSLRSCASTQCELVWTSGICCCRPNCLELTE